MGEREGKGEREVEHLDLVAREAHQVHHRAAHHWLQRAQHEERVSRRPRRDRQHLDAQPGVDLAVAHALRGAGAGGIWGMLLGEIMGLVPSAFIRFGRTS